MTTEVVEILTASSPSEGGMEALGAFTLRHDQDLDCLYHIEPGNNGEPGTGGRLAIVWPFGYSAVGDQEGVVVLDEDGLPVARTGVSFQIGGGHVPHESDYCDSIGTWIANGPPIESLPSTDG